MRRVSLCLLALACVLPSGASAEAIHFRGETVDVPAGWPVFRLAEHPRMCVRLDRAAVYLGTPGRHQRCPAEAIGRRRAILVDPDAGARAARARAQASRVPPARISASGEYTGLGFDACTAPSRRSMTAWEDSPYRAIGVYIGGLNRGCAQPNLTASWVSEQIAAGWHLIPTYVGLQAPTSSCTTCARLSASAAIAQGTAAADDAVAQTRALAIGPGSPIYFDMESYARGTSASNATLAFLEAWTARLHALGYVSGVYSSSASGIADLAARLGSDYLQPDHLWMANWNGRASSDDPYVPDDAWADHQRIHQYRGGHDETYGGVTINIDNNYVEGATVGASTTGGDAPRGRLDFAASPQPGQVRVSGWAFDPSEPTQPVAIRAYVGGKRGVPYELGPVAGQARADVGLAHPAAGSAHGFDVSFPVVASGPERVCVYAVDLEDGADKALGCRRVGIRVPISVTGVRATQKGLWVGLRCEWPAGTQCPGQILLQARVSVRSTVRRRGRLIARTRSVRARIARRTFRLTGGRYHPFSVKLDRRGRELTSGHTELRVRMVVAIPGGRVGRTLTLTPGRGLPR